MLKNIFKRHKISGKSNGYTLIELLIYVALFVIIGAVVVQVFTVITKVNSRIVSLVELNSNASEAMERMIYEIRNSGYVYTPTSNFLNYNHNTAKGYQLSLATSQNPPAGESLSYVDFYLENGTIFIKTDGVNSVALTSPNINVESMQFDYYKNDKRESVKIDMVARPTNSVDSSLNIHLVTTVALRQ